MSFEPNEPIEQEVSPPEAKRQNPALIGVLIVVILALVFVLFWVMRQGGGDNGESGGGPTILPTATIVAPTPAPGEPSATAAAADGVNIRSGPGVNHDIIGILPNGASAPIIGISPDGLWWVLGIPAAPNGQGWVAAEFVVVENAENVPVILPPSAPASTATPVPGPTETPVVTILFSADSTAVNAGQCTNLRWKVDNVREVYVYPAGEPWENYPQAGEGSQEVCPPTTTIYEMRVIKQDGSVDQRQLTVTVIPVNPLAETSWLLTSMYVNQLPIPDTEIALSFDDAKGLSGEAGCNAYGGSYTLTGDRLAIGPLTVTQQTCGEEVDNQEQIYLMALQSAATYTLSGDQLIIYDANVNELLRFSALKAVPL